MLKGITERMRVLSGHKTKDKNGNEGDVDRQDVMISPGSGTTDSVTNCPNQQPGTESEGSDATTAEKGQAEKSLTVPNQAWVCMHCKEPFHEMQSKILECEVCSKHACAKCLQLTPTQYTATQRTDLIWLCSDKCRRRMRKALRDDKDSDDNQENTSVLASIKKMEERLVNIEGKIQSVNTERQTAQTNNETPRPTPESVWNITPSALREVPEASNGMPNHDRQ